MDRRELLAALMATAISSRTEGRAAAMALPEWHGQSLIPDSLSNSPNYWCTWAAQNYMYGHHLRTLDPKILEGDSGSRLAHDAMTQEALFGAGGWVDTFYPKIRKELYLLLDDGWQVGGTSTFVLDPAKFPSFQGSPADRLSKLNEAIAGRGWRDTALWCRNPPGGNSDRHLESMSHAAGVGYWKIDIGDIDFHLVQLRDQAHIPLMLEHVHGENPYNGDWSRDGRFGPQPWGSSRIEILRHTDVYRTYDVTSILSLPTTLDRVAELLKGVQGRPEVHGLLNCEDEVYVAAALGCSMGIMRFPLNRLRPEGDLDLFLNGPRQAKKRMDEVARAVRWQRIAPPIPAGAGTIRLSDEILTDSWHFERGQIWAQEIIGQTVRQSAPASIVRNLALPEVKAEGDKPFVFATRFPNGAVAIAAQERTQVGKAWFMPACDVTLPVADAPGPFGVFGDLGSLTLHFDRPLQGKRVLAQDLMSDEAIDLSSTVHVSGDKLFISGEVIRKIGLSHRTAGDVSSPGLILALV